MRGSGRGTRLVGLAGAVLGTIFSTAVAAADSSLTVVTGGRTAIYTAAGLLTLPAATTVTIPVDAVYGTSVTFRAVPFAMLINGAAPDSELRFLSGDRIGRASCRERVCSVV